MALGMALGICFENFVRDFFFVLRSSERPMNMIFGGFVGGGRGGSELLVCEESGKWDEHPSYSAV